MLCTYKLFIVCGLLSNIQSLHPSEASAGEREPREKTLAREKRTAADVGIYGLDKGIDLYNEYYRPNNIDECKITTFSSMHRSTQPPQIKFIFKSQFADDENTEHLGGNFAWFKGDVTKEKITGGRLKLIQSYTLGKYCVSGVIFSCGAHTLVGDNERTIIMDVATIKAALRRQSFTRRGVDNFSKDLIQYEENGRCLWFSASEIRAIDIYPEAFTECYDKRKELLVECVSNHIEVIGGVWYDQPFVAPTQTGHCPCRNVNLEGECMMSFLSECFTENSSISRFDVYKGRRRRRISERRYFNCTHGQSETSKSCRAMTDVLPKNFIKDCFDDMTFDTYKC